MKSRDARFDGQFFTAVKTTRIYCRPSCPAVTPRRQNVAFYRTAAAAHLAGFRACKRCLPDASPGSPEWNVRQDITARAMRLIADGVVERDGVAGLGRRLGYSPRQLNRQLLAEVGAGPLALARAHRAQTARILLETTELRIADVAFAAGFKSIRQFNDSIKDVFAATPSDLRRSRRKGRPARAGALTLRLAYRRPFDAGWAFRFLGHRAVPGVESFDGITYSRSLALHHGTAVVAMTPEAGFVSCSLWLEDVRDLNAAVQRCRGALDLDADPEAIDESLRRDALLAPVIERHRGMRVPRTADPHELAFRAVLGQQVSVAGARTLAARLVERFGTGLNAERFGVNRLFPTAATLASADPATLSMPRSRGRALVALADALAGGDLLLDTGADPQEVRARLRELPGIGPWTAAYVSMRALGDPDVFLAGDLGVRRALERAGAPGDAKSAERRARSWQPWRSYATQLLWASLETAPTAERRTEHEEVA